MKMRSGAIFNLSAFDPLSLITGSGGFWRADKGVTQSGGNVTAWADQSSFVNTLSVVNTDPLFGATSFNSSFPGIGFGTTSGGASSTNLQTAALSNSKATLSMFVLLKFVDNAASNRRIWNLTNNSAQDNVPGGITISASGGFSVFSNVELGNGGSVVSVTQNNNYLLGFVADGANVNKWLNGSVQGSGTSFTSNLGDTAAKFGLGANLNAQSADMVVAFCGATQKAMNTTDWTNLKNWSNANWGTSF